MKAQTNKRYFYTLLVIFQLISSQMCADPAKDEMNNKYKAIEKNNEALSLLQSKNIERAKELFEEAAKLDSSSPEYPSNIGFCYLLVRDLEKAEFYFKKSLEIEPNFFRANYNLGVVYQNRGDIVKAKDYYLKSTEDNPQFPEARYNLALMYLKLGEKKLATEAFRKFISIAPTDTMSQPIKDAKERIKELEK